MEIGNPFVHKGFTSQPIDQLKINTLFNKKLPSKARSFYYFDTPISTNLNVYL